MSEWIQAGYVRDTRKPEHALPDGSLLRGMAGKPSCRSVEPENNSQKLIILPGRKPLVKSIERHQPERNGHFVKKTKNEIRQDCFCSKSGCTTIHTYLANEVEENYCCMTLCVVYTLMLY